MIKNDGFMGRVVTKSQGKPLSRIGPIYIWDIEDVFCLSVLSFIGTG